MTAPLTRDRLAAIRVRFMLATVRRTICQDVPVAANDNSALFGRGR